MVLENQNILFVTRAPIQGGTENIILQLCEILKGKVNKIVVCAGKGINQDKLAEMGVGFYKISDIEKKDPITIYKVSRRICQIVKTENITLIHTHHRMAAFYVALLGLYKKCYFFNTCHNTFTNKKWLTRFAYKHANLIACGEMVKQNLINEFELPDSQIIVIHNAVKPFDGNIKVDPVIYEMRKKGCFIVANVGRLSEQKGMDYYLRAIPAVKKKHPDVFFVVIGSGEKESRLKAIVEELEIADRVYFMGYRLDVQNLMAQVDLIVLSSLWEGFPLIPIEAFSVGKTIVATSVDGTPEIVSDGINGLLVEARNIHQISKKINWMIEHPKEKENMESNGKEDFIQKFSMDKFAVGYINYYCKGKRL